MSNNTSPSLAQSKKRRFIKETAQKAVVYVLLSVVGVFMLVPFMWMVTTSLKDAGSVFVFSWIPRQFEWRNYAEAWKGGPTGVSFTRFFMNSIFVSSLVTFGQVFTCAFAAFAFARLKFWGRDKLFLAYLGTMMIPGAVTMIPVYILLSSRYLNWVNSYKALIIPGMFGGAFGTFLLRQFFLTIPKDLEDAARIDGCSTFGIFWRIILPLSKPALATLTTFTFMGVWNDFIWPLIVINTMEKKTLPVALASFQGMYSTDWHLLMAASTIVLMPVLIVYLFNQRFFVRGIVLTGLKQ